MHWWGCTGCHHELCGKAQKGSIKIQLESILFPVHSARLRTMHEMPLAWYESRGRSLEEAVRGIRRQIQHCEQHLKLWGKQLGWVGSVECWCILCRNHWYKVTLGMISSTGTATDLTVRITCPLKGIRVKEGRCLHKSTWESHVLHKSMTSR